MKTELKIEDLKKIQLDMLLVLHEFCVKENIRYFLTTGTLLGAIRHKGYIPWDDDIDIVMPRNDYERFIKEYNEMPLDHNLKVISSAYDKDYYLQFAKLINIKTVLEEEVDTDFKMGVYIDIFPLDNMSDDYEEAKKIFYKTDRLKKILILKNLVPNKRKVWVKNLIIRVGKVVFSCLDRGKLLKKIDELSRKYYNEPIN